MVREIVIVALPYKPQKLDAPLKAEIMQKLKDTCALLYEMST